MLFKSEILIKCKGREVNAKSCISILSLCISENSDIDVIINGEDEVSELNAIRTAITNTARSF